MTQTKTGTNVSIIGIDVAKDKLDIMISPSGQHIIIENKRGQIGNFIKRTLSKITVGKVIMESTGGYEHLAFEMFSTAKLSVHIAHPNRVFHYGKSKGLFGKTDKIDANMLACYGQDNELSESKFDRKKHQLQSLSNRYLQIKEDLAITRCRLSAASLISETKKSLCRQEVWLNKELELIESKLNEEIRLNPELKEMKEFIMSVKGVGPITANILLTQMDELGSLNKREVASMSGLAPRNDDSGKKKGRRRIMGGRSAIRKTLFLCALSASKHNSKLKIFYQRLIAKGKKPKVALIAVARKLIVIINELIAKRITWNENHEKNTITA